MQEPDSGDRLPTILTLIDTIPRWPLLGLKTSGKEKELVLRKAQFIEECAFRISQFSSDDIRQAIVRYEESIKRGERPSDRREALFFLNKYLFDIPEHVGRDSPRFAVIDTGWSDMPAVNDSNATKPSDKALARWPWSADKKGNWHFLVERRIVMYDGPTYNPVSHFDRLLATFGRRDVHQEQGTKPQAEQPVQRKDEP